MKTICQQLNIKEFPFEIKDSNNNEIYLEYSTGFWVKREYNSNNKLIYCENSEGYWAKKEYDSNNNEIYYENSEGEIIDKRSKQIELTLEEIAEKFNINVNDLKIKK